MLTRGVWVVSGSSSPDGTVLGTASTGVKIVAGPKGTATGAVESIASDGTITVSGSAAPAGVVLGTTSTGRSIVAGGDGAPVRGTVVGQSISGGAIYSEGTAISTVPGGARGTYLTTIRTSTDDSIAASPDPVMPANGDYTYVISGNLGRGVSMNSLFPFILNWSGNSEAGGRSFTCEARESSSGRASIQAIDPSAGTITVTGPQGRQTIKLGGCTKLQANTANYKLSIGDKVEWSGYRDDGVINAASVLCYA